MLFLMRGKLQIEWDLTFNSMYKHICILIKIYLVSISAIHKIAFQIKWAWSMGVPIE